MRRKNDFDCAAAHMAHDTTVEPEVRLYTNERADGPSPPHHAQLIQVPHFAVQFPLPICDAIMPLLTDLPAELRQHIIRLIPGGVPAEVRLDHHRWPDPVNQLLVTCKLLRADAIRVMSTWSFDCLISRSAYIERLPRLIRAIKALGLDNKIERIRLLVWSLIEIRHIRDL